MMPTPKARMGRVMLGFVFAQMFLVLILAPPGILYLHGIDDLTAPGYRMIFTIGFVEIVVFSALGYLMWIGHPWARWVASFIMFAMSFIALTYVSDVQGAARMALLGMVLYELILAATLAFSTNIDHFIRDQERFRLINL